MHIPFCVRRCRYCDFATSATPHGDALIGAYVKAMAKLVDRLAASGLLADIRTAYLGGGTPTMAGDGLAGLVGAVTACCPSLVEFSSEANPESLDAPLAARLQASGLTRISLGVQSLADTELVRLGRVHTADEALHAARSVVAAGLDLSCDLMCGIPAQTAMTWERSLEGVLATGATHVSCYPLAVEDGTPLARAIDAGEERLPDNDLQADLMLAAARILGAAGLARYEVASYARPGKACAHNVAYWTGVPYLGLGPAAASMLDRSGLALLGEALDLVLFEDPACAGEGSLTATDAPTEPGQTPAAYLAAHPDAARLRLRMLGDARSFVAAMGEGHPLPCTVEPLTAREAAAEDLMLGMRMSAGVGCDLLERAVCDGIPATDLERALREVCDRGLAAPTSAGGYAPTEQGWLLGNELYGALWDLA